MANYTRRRPITGGTKLHRFNHWGRNGLVHPGVAIHSRIALGLPWEWRWPPGTEVQAGRDPRIDVGRWHPEHPQGGPLPEAYRGCRFAETRHRYPGHPGRAPPRQHQLHQIYTQAQETAPGDSWVTRNCGPPRVIRDNHLMVLANWATQLVSSNCFPRGNRLCSSLNVAIP